MTLVCSALAGPTATAIDSRGTCHHGVLRDNRASNVTAGAAHLTGTCRSRLEERS